MKQLILALLLFLPLSLFSGWGQEITGGPWGDDTPATKDSPKLYYHGTPELPYYTTEYPIMYPEDRLWYDVMDKDLVLRDYIREVVGNRYLNVHKWAEPQDYYATEPMPGRLDWEYLKALHARMAFVAKLQQLPYTVGTPESHTKANISIMWADYNNMVDHGSLWVSNGEGISYPGWVAEADRYDFWEHHHRDMNTNLLSGPGANWHVTDTSDFVDSDLLPIDPTHFLILSPHHTRAIFHGQALLRPMIWSLSDSRNAARTHAHYGTLPQDRVYEPSNPLAYYVNKMYPFLGHTPSTLTPNTWFFATGLRAGKRPYVLDEETGQWKTFWEPNISEVLPSSHWELWDDKGQPIPIEVEYVDRLVAFTPLDTQGNPVNLGRGIPNGEVRSFTVRGELVLKVQWMQPRHTPYVEEVPYAVEYTVSLVGTEQIDYVVWPDEEQVAYDLKYNAAWGYYNTANYPWIYRHAIEDWVFLVDDFAREDVQKNYFFSMNEQAWLYVTSQSAPYAYHLGDNSWNVY